MNCRSCEITCTLEDAKKAREAALLLINTPGSLPQADIDKAFECLDCAAKKMAEDATKRLEKL